MSMDRSQNTEKFPAKRSASSIQIHGHVPKLDSLRGAAILLVMVYHAYGGSINYRRWSGLTRFFLYLSRYGYTGVELFFVLSGFLITTILLKSKGRPDFYTHFYKRRALRILPAYLAILIVIKAGMGVTWKYILACLLYIANMAGIVGARTSEYAPLWSLAVEEQFYLVWPFCTRRLKQESLLKLVFAICIVMPLFRLLAASISKSIDIHYKTYFIADYLAYGAGIALSIQLGIVHWQNIRNIYRALIGIGSLLVIGVLYMGYEPTDSRAQNLILRSMGVLPFVWLYSGLVLYAIYLHAQGDQKVSKLLAFFGYISYGLYLIHEFIFNVYGKLVEHTALANIGGSRLGMNVRFLIVGSASVFLAYLSRRFYEEHFLRLGRRDAL